MKKLIKFILFLMISCFLINCSDDGGPTEPVGDDPPEGLTGAYFGLTPPGNTPVLFAPGVINYELHSPPVFSPDGNEVYWTPMTEPALPIQFMQKINNIWTDAVNATNLTGQYKGEPFYSYDGNTIYYNSHSNPNTPGLIQKENIWFVEREGTGWTTAQPLGPEVNSVYMHWTFSLNEDGDLYFSASETSDGFNDIYVSRNESGSFTQAELLGTPVNTDSAEDTPYIASDGSYLIFSRYDNQSFNPDLYISFIENEGSWGEPIAMTQLNTGGNELGPYVTYDGEYLFFLSSRTGELRPYWVDADIIEDYRPEPAEENLLETVNSIDIDVTYYIHIDSNLVYMTCNTGVLIYDIQDPENPESVGEIDLGGGAFGIFADNNFAYIGGINRGLVIADVSDPANPIILGEYSGGGISNQVYADGNYAFVTNSQNGLEIIDVSDPQNPSLVLEYLSDETVVSVTVRDNIAYLCCPPGLKIVDVTDKQNPQLIESILNTSGATDVYLHDDMIYLACAGLGIKIIRNTGNTKFDVLGSFYDGGESNGIWGNSDYVFTADDSEVEAIDISNPASLVKVGSITSMFTPHSIYGKNNHVFVTAVNPGFTVIKYNDR
ncbi:hypothetical protein ACFL6O_02065 [candidate division KSB1 bacterium]